VHLVLALLTIAAASDLQPVLPRLVALFEQQTGHHVRTTFGSSGNFYAQIQNGAPFDVFLSADIDYPRQLERAGRADGTVLQYATGSLVVWTRRGSGIDLRAGLAALDGDNVQRVAVANPEHAPYGRAAVAALTSAKLYERLRRKLVFGENVAQAAQFVQSGNADVGLLPLSLARSAPLAAAGEYVAVPASLYPPIEQAAIVLKSSSAKDAAREFLRFLRRPETRELLAQAGFSR
jgi:molybdate transport system substrate-binding protein